MTIANLRAQLERGTTTSRALCEAALARASAPAGEGALVFTEVYADSALAAADSADRLRQSGYIASALAGLPISIKDLFDVAGRVTLAGSKIRVRSTPATADATVVQRLRAAGAVIVGKTNMTEFAYSGLGINPHYGTPRNPFDRSTGRIPGGSSAGAAVSVTDEMAVAAIGTDTGGSVRIPAALCGLTGYKPTARRIPTTGAFPLSTTLDSIGPLAADVASCAIVAAIMAGDDAAQLAPFSLRGARFLSPTNYVTADCDATVTATFASAIKRIRAAGAVVDETPLPPLDRIPQLNATGGFSAAEAYRIHRADLETDAAAFDPQIALRIVKGKAMTAVDYIDLLRGRETFIADLAVATEHYDAMLWPTVPLVAPPVAGLLADAAEYARVNVLLLRNTSVVNFSDGCAVSLPMGESGALPTGFMVSGKTGEDARILRISAAIEAILRPV